MDIECPDKGAVGATWLSYRQAQRPRVQANMLSLLSQGGRGDQVKSEIIFQYGGRMHEELRKYGHKIIITVVIL